MSDYYELLQVPRNADADTIKKSYRRLARQFHPDSNKSRIASEHMKLLNAANDMLSDADKRREYDARLVDAERDAAQSDAFAAQPTPAVRRRPERPWLVWVAATGLLVLLTFIGTLFALRNSLPSISLALFASPTRAVLVLPTATTTRHPTATLTPLPSPTATATSSPSATATTARPTATATTLPRTATPTRLPPTPTTVPTAILPSPVPIVTAPILKLVTTEFPSGPNGGSDIIMSNTDGSVKINLTHSDGLSEQSPSWSPFGQHVVFSEANSGQLFVVTA
ncbi:MAG: DnaJ domain-containing protein, partial [Chloroflexota bacterium]